MAHIPDIQALLAILEAFALDPDLSKNYVLKGGNALRFGFFGVRASVDLDFSSTTIFANHSATDSEALLDHLCNRLNQSLKRVTPQYGFTALQVQKHIVLPPGKDPRMFPALQITVGYSETPKRKPPFSDIVRLDITLNDAVCEAEYITVEAFQVHISSLNDIIAEKLRSLLQQIPRNRYRPNDVFDVWFYVTKARSILDLQRIAAFLQTKSADKPGLGRVTREMFSELAVREHARIGYSQIASRLPPKTPFPEFDEAFDEVLAFIHELPLPETN